MAFLEFVIAFVAVVQVCLGFSSPITDDLEKKIEVLINETQFVELRNQELLAEIDEQTNQFKNEYGRLQALTNSDNEEINKIVKELNTFEVELRGLSAKKAFLIKRIDEKKQLFRKVYFGLKWLREDWQLLEKREHNKDQNRCFELGEGSLDDDTETIQVRRSGETVSDMDIVVLEIELKQAVISLKNTKRRYEELSIKLAQDKEFYIASLVQSQKLAEDVTQNLDGAKQTLEIYKKKCEITNKEVEQLQTGLDNLKKGIKNMKTEAGWLADKLKSYEKAIACYDQYEAEAMINDDDELTDKIELEPVIISALSGDCIAIESLAKD